MKTTMKQQRGATFLGWVSIAGIAIFGLVTLAKLVPSYLEYRSVQTMVDEMAVNPAVVAGNTQTFRSKVGEYLNMNSLYGIKPEYFSVVTLPEQGNKRALQVDYEVRRNWLANIDFAMRFNHTAPLGRQ